MSAVQDATAIVQQQQDLVCSTVKLPELQNHQAYVKVDFSAFNPTDRMPPKKRI